MSTFRNRALGFLLVPVLAGVLSAQGVNTETAPAADTITGKDSTAKAVPAPLPTVPAGAVQNIRPRNFSGINVFETPKNDGAFEGVQLRFGGAFSQQFQGLKHENTAAPRFLTGSTVNQNQLLEIGYGFNTAAANLSLQVQLADGIRVDLITYLSSRHHNEAWVKGGYLQVDKLTFLNSATINEMMKYLAIRAGHFEINYGDAHLRRSDNGDALYNPFIGNLLMDAFTTEIGGDVMFRKNGFIAMAGLTGGEIKGNLRAPDDRAPSVLAKIGFDRQLNSELRARLTASTYVTRKSPAQTLYAGDRAGSRYMLVLENTAATEAGNASSGLFNPGFRREVTAIMVNPFVKYHGLELFGTFEQANGRSKGEAKDRYVTQYQADVVYRFLRNEQMYVGARSNTVNGNLAGITDRVGVERQALAAGWFMTPNVLTKLEWVTQKYNDFPTTDIRNGGKFKGFMVEAVVAF